MTVDIGYAWSPFVPQVLTKIAQADRIIREKGYHCLVQTDSTCNKDTYKAVFESGGRAFVMGITGLFGLDSDLEAACTLMKQKFQAATGVTL